MPSRAWPAHPRSRGENVGLLKGDQIQAGSSPLTRGKRFARLATVRKGRLIPAHAGKTVGARRRLGNQPAHPRSRGENMTCVTSWGWVCGSSPLTRGKPRVKSMMVCAQAAHPRSRGENGFARLGGGGVRGSSPLTRGKRGNGCDHEEDRGLIPAHAGKTP